MNGLIRGRYRHYKGGEYEVLDVALHSETGEEVVVYRALYGDYGLWVRPRAMFTETVLIDGKPTPRFVFVSTATQRRLGPDSWDAARAFIFTQCRPLEQALFRWHFEGGNVDEVLGALAAFRNSDGGFGHGLEPDLRTASTSLLATTTALQVLRLVGATAEQPLVRGAIAYLAGSFDAASGVWPLIPPTANDAPHAPWWTVGPEHADWFGGYMVNPRAEVVGHLYHYGNLVDATWLAAIAQEVEAYLAARAKPLDMNEILCALRLASTERAPQSLRAAATSAVRRSLDASLATSAEQWESYSLQPLALAPDPRAVLAQELAEYLPANLDFRIGEQEADGSWTPAWSWGDLYPDRWQQARREWQGVLTLEALRQLAAWGRLAF